MDDHLIIELYNKRDERAIDETRTKYGGHIFAVANGILGDALDAEECVSDTYLRVWNAIPPAEPKSLKAFLSKITRNLSLNRYNDKHRAKRGGGETAMALEEMDEFLAGTSDVQSEYERKEFYGMLDRFLYSLPKRQCGIFLRRYFYMESVETISRRYGIKEENVLVILSRVRKKLKETLEREGYML